MKKYEHIAEFGKKLIAFNEVESVLELIADEAKYLVDADRCSIFIVESEDKILWTKHSDGIGRIVLGLETGVVGATYDTKSPQIVNDPYKDERFLANIDKKSGYMTKNMITIPIFNSKREVMSIMQLLNKKGADFDKADLDLLTFFANYVSGSLELVLLSEER